MILDIRYTNGDCQQIQHVRRVSLYNNQAGDHKPELIVYAQNDTIKHYIPMDTIWEIVFTNDPRLSR